MTDINKLARPNIRQLKPYQSARSLMQGGQYIFLDANENPYGDGLNRYPDPYQQELKNRISSIKGVPASKIVLGNGSDEIIDMLMRSFTIPETENVIVHVPGFSMYAVLAETHGAGVREVSLDENFQPKLEHLWQQVATNTKLAFFCTPNNPTGNQLKPEVIEEFARQFHGLVIVDEAYIDFSEQASFIEKITVLPNIVVLQTFSKAWGMAGARLGMGFMDEEVAAIINKVKTPYNVNTLTIREALRRTQNLHEMQHQVNTIVKERKRVEAELKNLRAVLRVYPSDANFVLVKFRNVAQVMDFTRKEGIILRDRSNLPGCENTIRITIGTTEENNSLLKVLKKYDKQQTINNKA